MECVSQLHVLAVGDVFLDPRTGWCSWRLGDRGGGKFLEEGGMTELTADFWLPNLATPTAVRYVCVAERVVGI